MGRVGTSEHRIGQVRLGEVLQTINPLAQAPLAQAPLTISSGPYGLGPFGSRPLWLRPLWPGPFDSGPFGQAPLTPSHHVFLYYLKENGINVKQGYKETNIDKKYLVYLI